MNNKQVESFLKLQPQFKSAYAEISFLSKKKPNDQLNKFKLKFINNILSQANELLGKKYKPFPDEFDLFDEDDMPTNSDVVLIISQYETAISEFRGKYYIEDRYQYTHRWMTQTFPPDY